MQGERRFNLVAGLALLLIGSWFLAVQLVPGLGDWVSERIAWPLFIVGSGVLLLLVGLAAGAPGMAVPACIVTGIGAIIYWQNMTGNWASWSFTWTLIPGFVGVGLLLAGLLGEERRQNLREGGRLVLISLVMFVIFAAFFGGLVDLGRYWPVLLILLGGWLLLQPLLRRSKPE